MANDALIATIATALRIDPSQVHEDSSSATLPSWDSIAHLNLTLALEAAYKIRFATDEIPSLVSVSAIRRALQQRGV